MHLFFLALIDAFLSSSKVSLRALHFPLAAFGLGLVLYALVFSKSVQRFKLADLPNVGPLQKQVEGVRVAVVDTTTFHDEVIGSVLTTLEDLGVHATFYRHQERFQAGFEEVLTHYTRKPQSLLALEQHLADGSVNVIVLTTCDAKFWYDYQRTWGVVVEASLLARVVCIPHEIEVFGDAENKDHLAPFADRLKILTLADHATAPVDHALAAWGMNVTTASFTPVFGLPFALRRGRPPTRNVPRAAAILGRVHPRARRYEEIMADLLAAVQAEPKLWGYRFENQRLVPNSKQAFQLHIVGKPGPEPLDMPNILSDASVIVQHPNTAYADFYRIISSVDAILPAFKGQLYVRHRCSAAIPAAIIGRTPLLVDDDTLAAYSYLAPPAVVLYPSGLTEIEALGQLRRGGQSYFAASARQWDEYEQYLRLDNMRVWAEALAISA